MSRLGQARAEEAARAGRNGKPRPGDAGPALRTRRLADVGERPVDRIWENWLPLGMLTLFDGDPGLGKSTLLLDLAARVSRGWPMPGCLNATAPEAPVVILAAEDTAEQVIRPRLRVAGADLEKVHVIDDVDAGDGKGRPLTLPGDLEALERFVKSLGGRLLVVDPLFGFLNLATIDTNSDASPRQVLHAVKGVAERTGCTILCLRHLNKLSGGPAIYRGGGSIAFVGAARCAWVAGKHPDKPGTCVLAMNKSKVGSRPRSVEYELREAEPGVVGIAWGDTCDLTPDEILAPGERKWGEKQMDAVAFLAAELRAGPVPQQVLVARAEECGISERTLDRAKKRLGVKSGKDGKGPWMWSLPDNPKGANGATH